MVSFRDRLRRARHGAGRVRHRTLYRVRKLVRLTPGEFGEMIWAQMVLLWAQALLWVRPRGSLVDEAAPTVSAGPWDRETAQRLARAVNRAAYHGLFRPYCLVRAVALNRMLEAKGMRSGRIRLGVRLVNGRFSAHAWVDYDGVILGDDETGTRSFAELTDVRLLRR